MFRLGCEPHHKAAEKHDEHSEIGYCTSTDLRQFSPTRWGILRGRDSNESLWTGCTVRDGAQYLMFYTVRQHASGYWARQVLRLAVSPDLQQWKPVDSFELVLGVDLDRGGQKLLPSVFPALRYVDPESRRK